MTGSPVLTPLALPGFARSASAQETLESYRAAARGFGDVRVELRTYRQGEQQSSADGNILFLLEPAHQQRWIGA